MVRLAVVQFPKLRHSNGKCYCVAFRTSWDPGAKELLFCGAEQRKLVLMAGEGTSVRSTARHSSAGEEGARGAVSRSLATFRPFSQFLTGLVAVVAGCSLPFCLPFLLGWESALLWLCIASV